MLKMILIPAVAALTLGGAVIGTGAPARAQVGVEIGPGGARIDTGRTYRRERRRVIVNDDCRTVVRRHVRRNGDVVVRRTRVCD